MARSAGWNDWKEALAGNNAGAIFYRGHTEISTEEIASWYDEEGNWQGGDNTLEGITMSNKNPSFTRPSGAITSNYGSRADPFTGKKSFHGGVDFRKTVGDPVNTTAFGVVMEVGGNHSIWGTYVVMRHGSGYTTRYAHLSSIAWGVGTVLHRNPQLGKAGNTGYSTGPHLHYGLYRNGSTVNPGY